MVRKKQKKDFYDKLRDRVNTAKSASLEFSNLAKERAPDIGRQIGEQSREGLSRGFSMAKKATASQEKILELIEKLGSMKEKGLLTDEEFTVKKKELLDRL